MQSSNASAPPVPVVFWVLWFALIMGLGMVTFVVGGGIPKGEDPGPAPLIVWVPAGAAFLSLVWRFLLLPRAKSLQAKLPLMIVGLALAEGCGMISLFVIARTHPATSLNLLVAAFVCMLLYAPVYASQRSVKEEGGYQR